MSGLGASPNARAAASALSSPEIRNTTSWAASRTGRVRVTRGTSGAMPGTSTPTASRSRSPSASSRGNSEAVWPSGPRPSSSRSSSGSRSPNDLAQLVLVGAPRPRAGPARPGSGAPRLRRPRSGPAGSPWPSGSWSARGRAPPRARRRTRARSATSPGPSRPPCGGAAFGVEPPDSAMWPPARTRAAIRSAAAPATSSTITISRRPSTSSDHLLRRGQRGRVRVVAQQRLADALAEDARLAARGAASRSRCAPRRRTSTRCAVRPPGPRSSEMLMPRGRVAR